MISLAKVARDAAVARRAVEWRFQVNESESAIDTTCCGFLPLDHGIVAQTGAGRRRWHPWQWRHSEVKSDQGLWRSRSCTGAIHACKWPLALERQGRHNLSSFSAGAGTCPREIAGGTLRDRVCALAADDLSVCGRVRRSALAPERTGTKGAILKSPHPARATRPDALDKAADYMAGFVKAHPGSVDAKTPIRSPAV